MQATWMKLTGGAWGARVKGVVPARGETIDITKRNGGTSACIVASVIWKGEDRADGEILAFCTVIPRGKKSTATVAPRDASTAPVVASAAPRVPSAPAASALPTATPTRRGFGPRKRTSPAVPALVTARVVENGLGDDCETVIDF